MSESPTGQPPTSVTPLLGQLRQLIAQARTQALRAVDSIQVRTCWEIGRHIVEFEQGGAARAGYGKRRLPMLAEQLTQEFGKGFDASNLRYMRLFYLAFPKCDAPRRESGWTRTFAPRPGLRPSIHAYSMDGAARHGAARHGA